MGRSVIEPPRFQTLAGETDALARVWALRARSEAVQERRFRRLGGQLSEVGADTAVIALAQRAETDELLHKRMCADLAASYGWTEDSFIEKDAEIEAIWPEEMSLADRTLYEVVASCCLMETFNAGLLVAMHEAAQVREIKDFIHTILRDEVKHSQLGWAHLAAEQRRRDCGSLGGLLPKMLSDTVREELFSPPPPNPSDRALLAHGELTLAARLDNFKMTIAHVVLPGFESLGIDTSAAKGWLQSKLQAVA